MKMLPYVVQPLADDCLLNEEGEWRSMQMAGLIREFAEAQRRTWRAVKYERECGARLQCRQREEWERELRETRERTAVKERLAVVDERMIELLFAALPEVS